MSRRGAALVLALGALVLIGGLAARAKRDEAAGDKLLTIVKDARVRISGLRDFVFATGVNVPPPLEHGVCIYSSAGGRYTVTATGRTGGPLFQLAGGPARIVYRVEWVEAGGTTHLLQPGQTSASLAGADRVEEGCGGTPTARLRIALDPDSFAAAPPGGYADTLTLLVAPN